MKKAVIAIIVAGVVGAGIGTGIYIYSTHSNKRAVVKPTVVATKTTAVVNKPTETKNKIQETTKQENKVLDIFKNSKSITGVIAGNIDVTYLPNSIESSSKGFKMNEYYNSYSNQIMNINIDNINGNSFEMKESQNGQATGIYEMQLTGDTQASGTFKNVETGKVSKVVMNFSNNAKGDSNTNSQITQTSNSDNKSQDVTIGFLRNVISKEMGGVKIVKLGQKEVSTYEPSSGEDLYNKYEGDQYVVLIPWATNNVEYSSAPDNTKMCSPGYIINGESAWLVMIKQASAYLADGRDYSAGVLGANGHFYTNKELYDAAVDGSLLRQNQNGKYDKVTPEELSNQYYSCRGAKTVIGSNTSTVYFIGSDPNWQPPKFESNDDNN